MEYLVVCLWEGHISCFIPEVRKERLYKVRGVGSVLGRGIGVAASLQQAIKLPPGYFFNILNRKNQCGKRTHL